MSTIREITEKYEKAYIILKDTESRRRFVREALNEGVVFTDGGLPQLDKYCEVIVINNDKTIARLNWAGMIKFHHNADRIPVIKY